MRELLNDFEKWYRDLNSHKKTYEEVKLPFGIINEDYIPGHELESALTSDAVQGSMDDYRIQSVSKDPNFWFEAQRYGPTNPLRSSSAISFEGSKYGEYSHLRVEIAGKDRVELEKLSEDLDRLEYGLETYFSHEEDLQAFSDNSIPYAAD